MQSLLESNPVDVLFDENDLVCLFPPEQLNQADDLVKLNNEFLSSKFEPDK
jgi:hypothetical protein